MKQLTATLAAATLAMATFAVPVQAGGPVILEEADEIRPAPRAQRDVLPLILLGVVVAALVAGGGSDNCLVEDTPPPATGC